MLPFTNHIRHIYECDGDVNISILCMLGNFLSFFSPKLTFSKKKERIRMMRRLMGCLKFVAALSRY